MSNRHSHNHGNYSLGTRKKMALIEQAQSSLTGTSNATDEDENQLMCRICLEAGSRKDFIAPCHCRGGSKYVHRACLDQWRTTREDRAFSRCTECTATYVLISRVNDTRQSKMWRRIKFYAFCVRDLLAAFTVLQCVVILLAYTIFLSDSKATLFNYFHAGGHKLVFYYLCGLVVLLAALGCCYFCGFAGGGTNAADCLYCCSDTCYCNHPHAPLYVGDCCGCAECHCCAACCEGGASSLSAELMPVLLVLVIALALVGAIVAIFAGAVFIQQVVKNHTHVLQKRGLAHDFIVADLEEDKEDEQGKGGLAKENGENKALTSGGKKKVDDGGGEADLESSRFIQEVNNDVVYRNSVLQPVSSVGPLASSSSSSSATMSATMTMPSAPMGVSANAIRSRAPASATSLSALEGGYYQSPPSSSLSSSSSDQASPAMLPEGSNLTISQQRELINLGLL